MGAFKIGKIGGVLVFLLFLGYSMLAQDKRRDLESQREQIEREIQQNLQAIEKLNKTNKSISQEIFLLEKNIRNRQRMLEAINKELEITELQIRNVSQQITQTELDLNRQRKEYERLILDFQKNYRQYDLLQFLFSAETFNQAFLRFNYYRQYKDFLKQEIENIRQNNEKLSAQMAELNQAREERAKILERQKKELARLNGDKEKKNIALRRAKLQEQELKKDIEKKKTSLQLISQAIRKIIEEEAAQSKQQVASVAKEKPGKTTSAGLNILYSPEDIQLSGEFQAAKGNLPWPVEKGVITENFGEHPHPVLGGIKVKSNGITLSTEKGSRVKAVFGGKVSKVMKIGINNLVVILRHGQYLTVYSELAEVKVTEGQQVKASEVIGLANPGEEITSVHFEIWNQKTPEDPRLWLKK
ncbi:MAG: murein hydrolase activator EnvC family protein [Bacteroidales bacterium]